MLTREVEETLSQAVDEAVKYKHEYVTLEHLLYALVENITAADVLMQCGADLQTLCDSLLDYFHDVLEKMPAGSKQLPELTSTFQTTIQYAVLQAEGSGQPAVDGGNILAAFYQAEQSYAVYLLLQQGVTRLDILNYISHGISKIDAGVPYAEPFDDEEFTGRACRQRTDRSDRRAHGRDRAHDPGALPPKEKQSAVRRRTRRRENGAGRGPCAKDQRG